MRTRRELTGRGRVWAAEMEVPEPLLQATLYALTQGDNRNLEAPTKLVASTRYLGCTVGFGMEM